MSVQTPGSRVGGKQAFRMGGQEIRRIMAILFRGMKTAPFIAALMRAVIPAVITSCVAPLTAQPANTLVVPNAYANAEGGIGNHYPFNIGANTMR